MNIFYINENPELAAKMMTNKHVVKMVVESAQLLSTAHRVLDGYQQISLSKNNRKIKRWVLKSNLNNMLYKSTHINHPSSIWCRESLENYKWLYNHFIALGNEYTKRYNKIHKSIEKLSKILNIPPNNIQSIGFSPPNLAVPEKYLNNLKKCSKYNLNVYRQYYKIEKLKNKEDVQRFNSYLS